MWVAGAESTPKSDFVPDAERTRSPPKPKQHTLASRSVSIPPRSASSHLPASTGGNVATVGRLRKCIGMSHFVKQQFRYPQEEYTNAAKHGSSRGRNVAFMKNHAAQERLAYAMPRSAAMAPQHRSDLMNRLACRVLLAWARGRKRANEGRHLRGLISEEQPHRRPDQIQTFGIELLQNQCRSLPESGG